MLLRRIVFWSLFHLRRPMSLWRASQELRIWRLGLRVSDSNRVTRSSGFMTRLASSHLLACRRNSWLKRVTFMKFNNNSNFASKTKPSWKYGKIKLPDLSSVMTFPNRVTKRQLSKPNRSLTSQNWDESICLQTKSEFISKRQRQCSSLRNKTTSILIR